MKLTRALVLVALVAVAAGCKTKRHHVESAANTAFGPRDVDGPSGSKPTFRELKFTKLQVAPGEATTVEVDVYDAGDRPSGPVRLAVYASTNPRVVTAQGRTCLGSVDLPSVSQLQHVVIPITAPAQAGTYSVGLFLEAGSDSHSSAASQLVVR